CDHLVERRIGQERVRQVARRVGARACKLDGCRRARRFADVGVQRRRLPQTVRETERRIETLETMPAIELRRGTRSIVQANARRIEAAGYRQMRAVRQRQPVREISARNRHLALDVCEKLLDENARARSGTILKQARYFCHRMERRTTFLERDAYEQVVGPTGELRAPAQLQRPTIAILPAAADVVDRIQLLAVHLRRNRIASHVEGHLDGIVVIGGAFAITIQVDEILDQELVVSELAFLEDGAVAVETVRVDVSVIGVACEHEGTRQRMLTGKNELHL